MTDSSTLTPLETLEAAWAQMCFDAGWTPAIAGSPSMSTLRRYYAALDRLSGEREADLRRRVVEAKAHPLPNNMRYYVEGIEGAINRAITSPRTEEEA